MPNITKYKYPFLINLILSVCIITPFGNDEYIPALPQIAHELATTHAPWIMSIFLLGLAISQLFYGPLLDRCGRKPIIVWGLVIFIIGSFLTVIANSIHMLLLGRFIQAIGAASSIVSVLAIIRDTYRPQEIVKKTAFIMGIIAICPTLAPIVGNVLLVLGGWRACFAFLLLMGIFYLVIISIFLQETMAERNVKALRLKHLFFNYFNLLKHKVYLGFVLTSSFSYASLFCYFAVAPFLLINLLHVPIGTVGLIIAINAIPLLVISYLFNRYFHTLNLMTAVLIGSLFILAGGAFMIAANISTSPSLINLVLPMFVSAIGIGIIRPAASAGAIRLADKKIAGSASAVFTFFSFIGAAFFTMLTAKLNYHSVVPFAVLLTLLGFGALLSAIFIALSKATSTEIIYSHGDKAAMLLDQQGLAKIEKN